MKKIKTIWQRYKGKAAASGAGGLSVAVVMFCYQEFASKSWVSRLSEKVKDLQQRVLVLEQKAK